MDTQANQAGMEILSNTVALLNRLTILKEQNDELRVELEDKTNLRWSLESKIGELEVKVGVLQKSNANMAQVIGKESEHVKQLQKEITSLAAFVDQKYSGNVLNEWQEHLVMARKAHESEGNKDTAPRADVPE